MQCSWPLYFIYTFETSSTNYTTEELNSLDLHNSTFDKSSGSISRKYEEQTPLFQSGEAPIISQVPIVQKTSSAFHINEVDSERETRPKLNCCTTVYATEKSINADINETGTKQTCQNNILNMELMVDQESLGAEKNQGQKPDMIPSVIAEINSRSEMRCSDGKTNGLIHDKTKIPVIETDNKTSSEKNEAHTPHSLNLELGEPKDTIRNQIMQSGSINLYHELKSNFNSEYESSEHTTQKNNLPGITELCTNSTDPKGHLITNHEMPQRYQNKKCKNGKALSNQYDMDKDIPTILHDTGLYIGQKIIIDKQKTLKTSNGGSKKNKCSEKTKVSGGNLTINNGFSYFSRKVYHSIKSIGETDELNHMNRVFEILFYEKNIFRLCELVILERTSPGFDRASVVANTRPQAHLAILYQVEQKYNSFKLFCMFYRGYAATEKPGHLIVKMPKYYRKICQYIEYAEYNDRILEQETSFLMIFDIMKSAVRFQNGEYQCGRTIAFTIPENESSLDFFRTNFVATHIGQKIHFSYVKCRNGKIRFFALNPIRTKNMIGVLRDSRSIKLSSRRPCEIAHNSPKTLENTITQEKMESTTHTDSVKVFNKPEVEEPRISIDCQERFLKKNVRHSGINSKGHVSLKEMIISPLKRKQSCIMPTLYHLNTDPGMSSKPTHQMTESFADKIVLSPVSSSTQPKTYKMSEFTDCSSLSPISISNSTKSPYSFNTYQAKPTTVHHIHDLVPTDHHKAEGNDHRSLMVSSNSYISSHSNIPLQKSGISVTGALPFPESGINHSMNRSLWNSSFQSFAVKNQKFTQTKNATPPTKSISSCSVFDSKLEKTNYPKNEQKVSFFENQKLCKADIQDLSTDLLVKKNI